MLKKVKYFTKISQLISSQAKIWTQSYLIPKLCSQLLSSIWILILSYFLNASQANIKANFCRTHIYQVHRTYDIMPLI